MSDEQSIKMFVANLRRVLYVSKILLYNMEWLRHDSECPGYLKQDMGNLTNSINRLMSTLMCRTNSETWECVRMELDKDELHDLNLMLDCLYDVKNVGEIVQVIEKSKLETIES